MDRIILPSAEIWGQSNAIEAWFLICSCICGFCKELCKICTPTQVVYNLSSVTDRTGMIQTHIITQYFISHRWREHPSILEAISYHLLRLMVPLSTHNKLKEEVLVLKKNEFNRQNELSKLIFRIKTLKSKSRWTLLPSTFPSSSFLVLESSSIISSTRWRANIIFPRVLYQSSIFLMDVRHNTITHGEKVIEYFRFQLTIVSIGNIAKEWGKWLPVL